MDLELRRIELAHESDPILIKEPAPWDFNNSELDPKNFNTLMLENMMAHRGLGLSANQIGIPFKVFSMYVSDTDGIVCYNPNIKKESDELVSMKEGCLSFPHLYLNIHRPKEIWVEYQNADGDMMDAHFDGLAARIFHHEMDHMIGNVFVDKVSKLILKSARRKQKSSLRKSKKDGRTS
jgi:peptide deformylase